MKFILFLSLFLLTFRGFSQDPPPVFDQALADRLGADEFGMKHYVLVLLKTGKTEIHDKALRDSLFKGHMDNITRLSDLGQLVVAGPFSKNDQAYRGLFILNVTSFEEAGKLLQPDPTISNGLFEPLYFDWYGSAALPEYLGIHRKIQKSPF